MGSHTQYIAALLQNPEFLKTIAKQYGKVLESDHGLVCHVSMEEVAKAILDLETALSAKFFQ